jgi:multidrug efflux pump subunit AcrA (membrane-fusion protein)
MSDTHPSSPKLKRGRGRHRLRQILDCWPLLIWIAVLAAAVVCYNKGIVFTRMNGVVDVYQGSISPPEAGVLVSLAPGIETGKPVTKRQIVAQMDTGLIDLEIKRFLDRHREKGRGSINREREYLNELLKDKSRAWSQQAQTAAELVWAEEKLAEMIEFVPTITTQQGREMFDALTWDVKKLKIDKGFRDDEVKRLDADIAEQTAIIASASGAGTLVLDAEDERQLEMLKLRKDRMTLRAQHDGIIDRIGKEPGEFVDKGEFVVKVVASAQEIRGFLPQDEIDSVKKGDTVWITSTINRRTTFQAKVIDLSPRIDSVRDAASPLPNQAIRGREVRVEYPEGCGLLPGQTVIIHVKPPGQIPILGNILGFFSGDDSKPKAIANAPDPSDGYDLRLMSVDETDDLPDAGRSLVIVALVGSDAHVRIFDESRDQVIDKPEAQLVSGQELTELKELLNSSPFPDESDLSPEEKQGIINKATSTAGHTPSDGKDGQ